MKNLKIIVLLTTATYLLLTFTACGSDNSNETAKVNTTASTTAESQQAKITVEESEEISPEAKQTTKKGVVPDTSETAVAVKTYTHSDKAFTLKDCTTSLFMVNGWEILSGGTATDQQCDEITSFPAVLQYLDTKTTLTVTVVDEVEEKETFLANTKESYITAYGSAYDSIDITEFEQLSVDEFDSFRIKANVVIKGESFTMIHVLSNDVSGKTFSWMLLDSNGEFDDFDLVEAICYPKIVDTSKYKRFDREDLDSYYKFNIDDFR